MATTREELYRLILADYLTYENIAVAAHEEWLRDGRPDGDGIRQTPFGAMRIRDCHWHIAETTLGVLAEMDADTLWHWQIDAPDVTGLAQNHNQR